MIVINFSLVTITLSDDLVSSNSILIPSYLLPKTMNFGVPKT